MQWRIDTIRAVDKDCLIAAHGVGGAIPNMAAGGSDDWLAASKVELYGLTWVPSRRGFKPWQNFFGPDITRAAARGKKWWHAERPGGPLWLQPQVLGRDKEDGRVMDPEDIRDADHDLVRRRRHRRAEPPLPPAARRPAVRRLRLLRHGRLAHAALRRGEPHREMGQRTRAEAAVGGAAGRRATSRSS